MNFENAYLKIDMLKKLTFTRLLLQKKIVGIFDIGDIIRARPKDLWDQFGHLSGINEAEFFNYFQDVQIGFAIEIKHLVILDTPIDPREKFSGFTPPQSFCYLKYSLVP